MKLGKVDAVLVIPKGFGAAFGSTARHDRPAAAAAAVRRSVQRHQRGHHHPGGERQVEAGFEQHLNQVRPVAAIETTDVQGGQLSASAFFVPSILAMALMQLGIFSAIPLVEQREKKILKRLSATPLPRWALVGSNIVLRLIIAAAQTIIILAVGSQLFQVAGDGQSRS